MTRTLITALVLTSFSISTSALADSHEDMGVESGASIGPQDNQVEVGAFIGGFLPSDDHEFYDFPDRVDDRGPLNAAGFDIGIRLAYLPIRYFGIEGEFEIIPIGFDDGTTMTSGRSATLFGLRTHLMFQFPARVTPFVLGGFGMLSISSDSDAAGSDTDAFAHLGIGAKFYVTNSLSIRADGRLFIGPKYEPLPGDEGGDATTHLGFLVGASWTFGGTDVEEQPEPKIVENPDPDGDGILGDADKCPDEAGQEPDGCPDKDSDGDGFLDSKDGCPTEAETVNGFEDSDGCPDKIPDSDGDGIDDQKDGCPNDPEDADGYEDADGCPDNDNDKDGVVDAADRCPMKAGPVENGGCPDTDRDGDGVVDRLDNCPDEPGTAKNQGCKKKQLVVITQNQLKILDKVFFSTNKAKIRKRSNRLLDNVASVISAHPEIKKIRVEGHTDDRGKDEYNKELSQKRADAVVQYLIGKGVSVDRLEAVGFGEEKPIEDNTSKKGRAANRRVEFNIAE